MKKGFTLIELIMVIVIVAILAAIAIPRFLDLQKNAELGVAKSVGGALKQAREFYFSRLVLEGVSATNANSLTNNFNTFVDVDGDHSSDRNTFSIEDSVRALLTDPNATVLSGNTITFNFKSGAVATYTVDSGTGKVTETFTGF